MKKALLGFAAALFMVGSAWAQDAPDFSGTFELNPRKGQNLGMAQMTKADALLRLVVESLRIGPKLQLQGDHLAEDFGLTSSRWTFLSYVANADRPLSVADLARRMSISSLSNNSTTMAK